MKGLLFGNQDLKMLTGSCAKKMGQRRPGDVLIKLIFMQLIIRLPFNVGSVSRSQKDSQSLIGHH